MTNNNKTNKHVIYLLVDNEHWYLGSIFTWIKYLYSLVLTGVESLDVCCAENLPQKKPEDVTWSGFHLRTLRYMIGLKHSRHF